MMDESMIEKIEGITKTIRETRGGLKLLACVWKEDLKKWDIVVSADWINYRKSEENFGDIFDAFKKIFNGEFALRFSGIYTLEPKENFAQEIIKTLTPFSRTVKLTDVRFAGIKVDEIVIFAAEQ